jgi:hypothetical protein
VGEVLKRRALHRATFGLAAVYNVTWGLFAAADPQWFFRFSGMAPLNHPDIYACRSSGPLGCSSSSPAGYGRLAPCICASPTT